MADFNGYQQHENLSKIKKIVAIGGGHGLGRVMSALSFMNERLTAIVTTTDNGGSTGRIRSAQGGIAWGDLRNCLNQIIIQPSTASALFEYRFSGNGELAGHNLGNLMLKALEDLHIRPMEAVNLIRDLLDTVGDPWFKAYVEIGRNPPISTGNLSIASSPKAHIVVTGQSGRGGINVYRYHPETKELEKIWVAD